MHSLKNSLMVFDYFIIFLSVELKNIHECTLEKNLLKSFGLFKHFLRCKLKNIPEYTFEKIL